MPKLLSAVDDPTVARRVMAAILLIAAAARIVFFIVLPDQSVNLPDAATYRTAADDILRLQVIGISNVMPGYSLLIAMTGGSVIWQTAADILLSVATVWLVARIVFEITKDELAALTAAAIWAVYPMAVFYAVVGLSETLFVFLLLLGFYFCYRGSFWIGSIALVLAILTRPLIELIAPLLVLIFALVVHRRGLRRGLLDLAKFAVVYLVLMAPWWAHNYARYGSFVRLNAGAGYVLYSGNNPMNQSGGGIGAVDVDDSAFTAIADPFARDRAMQQAAFDYIRENPRRFVEAAAQKFLRLWRLWPYTPAYAHPAYVIGVAASFIPILAFGIGGLVWGFGRYWRYYLPMILFMLYTTAVHMVTIGSVRYRFPMEPMLAVFAAPLIAAILRRVAAGLRPVEGRQA
jgi:4-amino-4-deoxy-L-arabinose transferase-like glycosyltransferase